MIVHVAKGKISIEGKADDGTITPIAVTPDGEIKTTASFGDVIIESQGVNTDRDIFEGTINTASSVTLTFANVTTGYEILVANDTAGYDLKLRLNGEPVGNTIKGQSVFAASLYKFTSAIIRNDSGASIDYRVIISGV
jgi:hypothetical protein